MRRDVRAAVAGEAELVGLAGADHQYVAGAVSGRGAAHIDNRQRGATYVEDPDHRRPQAGQDRQGSEADHLAHLVDSGRVALAVQRERDELGH
ncbi:MAG: hypothetical protein ABI912_07840 [Actinomycetota bacterium]